MEPSNLNCLIQSYIKLVILTVVQRYFIPAVWRAFEGFVTSLSVNGKRKLTFLLLEDQLRNQFGHTFINSLKSSLVELFVN